MHLLELNLVIFNSFFIVIVIFAIYQHAII